MLTVAIIRETDQWDELSSLESKCQQIVLAVATKLNLLQETSEISFVFTNDEEIRLLNKEWRNNDKATNVLSFPSMNLQMGDKLPPLLGDIVLAHETILEQSTDQGKDFWDHVTYLIIHGILHLLGYDHDNQETATNMENLEINILKALEIDNPYALF